MGLCRIELEHIQSCGIGLISLRSDIYIGIISYLKPSAFRAKKVYSRQKTANVEKIIQGARGNYANLIVQKGDKKGILNIVKHLKSGGSLGNLADQKLREGIEIEFFGRKVMAPVI